MGAVERIIQLQRQYHGIAKEHNSIRKQWETLNERYGGGRERRHARLEEIKRQLSETLRWGTDQHGEFDVRHNLQINGRTRTWTTVPGCPDCDRKQEESGRNALKRERAQIYEWNKELNGYVARFKELRAQAEAVVADINREAHRLGLPSFEASIDGKSFIAATGTVTNFSARGQYVLDAGTSVTYGSTTAVLDSLEQIVAYRTGGSEWTVMRVAARPRIVTRRGWYSVMRSGNIELMIGPDGESTNSYPHVHVIHDETRNEIRVVASRSSVDHSSPEVLSGNASGNEVNDAIERALRLL